MRTLSVFVLFVAGLAGRTLAQVPVLTARIPAPNALMAPRTGAVALTFSVPMSAAAASGAAVQVYSSQRGGRLTRPGGGGTFSGGGTPTIQFQPAQPWLPGEVVTVVTTRAATTATAADSLAAGQAWQFTAAAGAGGQFVRGVPVAVGTAGWGLSVADFTGDGLPDVLVRGDTASGIGQIWRGDGLGGLLPGAVLPGGGSFWTSTDLLYNSPPADYDGDGDLDLATVTISQTPGNNSNTAVEVWFNDGTGAFQGRRMVTAIGSGTALHLAAADLNADGRLDLVAAMSDGLLVCLQRPDSTYAPASVLAVGALPKPQLADIDHDGDLDLLVGDLSGPGSAGAVYVLRNDGLGRFGPAVSYATAGPTDNLQIADLDGDGDLDFAAISRYQYALTLYTNDGTGAFARRADVPLGIVCGEVLAAFDADGDGDLDIVVGCSSPLLLLLNDGAGHFAPAPANRVPATLVGLMALTPADMNQDGAIDLVALAHDSAGTLVRVQVLLNQVPTGLSEAAATASRFTLSPNPAHHTVRLTGAPAGPATLVDALGRPVRTWHLASGTSDLSVEGLAPGLYTVRVGGQARRLVVE